MNILAIDLGKLNSRFFRTFRGSCGVARVCYPASTGSSSLFWTGQRRGTRTGRIVQPLSCRKSPTLGAAFAKPRRRSIDFRRRRRRGIEIDRGQPAWRTGRELINSHRRPLVECSLEELGRGQLDVELTQLDSLGDQLADVERRLDVIANEDERIQRVRTIPGVGRKTAEVIVTALDDVDRFDNARQVSTYIGLVPRQYQSGETDRNGRITKRGSRLLRTMLVECAWLNLRYNEWSRTTYDRTHGGQQTRKKNAAISLARKIAVVAWSMLKHETDWDPQRTGIAAEGTAEEGSSMNTHQGRCDRVSHTDASSIGQVAENSMTS